MLFLKHLTSKLVSFLRYSISALVGVPLVAILLTVLSNGNAFAGFTCGPNTRTYRVISLSGAFGQGVRCVKFISGGSVDFIWYGEGYWYGEGNTYRHVGTAYRNGKGTAGDIFGNGESGQGFFFESLRVTKQSLFSKLPQTIFVRGAWNEKWVYEVDQTVQEYTSRLGSVKTCGSNFANYTVVPISPRTGVGTSCVLATTGIWYSEG